MHGIGASAANCRREPRRSVRRLHVCCTLDKAPCSNLITSLIAQTGYLGIALLMLAENVFPPIPAELIMPLAGLPGGPRGAGPLGVLLAGSIGSLAGALLWYEVGRRIGVERAAALGGAPGRWFTMAPEQVDRAVAWLRRHGARTRRWRYAAMWPRIWRRLHRPRPT